ALLGGGLFRANSITHNTISWTGARPISLRRDVATRVAFNCITDAAAAIWLDHSTDAIIEGNRTAGAELITRVEQTGLCSIRPPAR
ncbi:MAG: hypothetical protein N3G20_09035, partial [Verrucomicrobiae bacterium]|nr:hypothetical protein [Verrucomicrobiae bacterium]